MPIEHVALWTADLERLRAFYETYFGAQSGPKYTNPAKAFESYFLRFESGARLELMHVPELIDPGDQAETARRVGLTHLAFSVGAQAAVETLTERLRADGYRVVGEPRHTGDGYYESAVLDPDGNRIEITE